MQTNMESKRRHKTDNSGMYRSGSLMKNRWAKIFDDHEINLSYPLNEIVN